MAPNLTRCSRVRIARATWRTGIWALQVTRWSRTPWIWLHL